MTRRTEHRPVDVLTYARQCANGLRWAWAHAEGTTKEQIGAVIQELTCGESWRSIALLAAEALAGTKAADG